LVDACCLSLIAKSFFEQAHALFVGALIFLTKQKAECFPSPAVGSPLKHGLKGAHVCASNTSICAVQRCGNDPLALDNIANALERLFREGTAILFGDDLDNGGLVASSDTSCALNVELSRLFARDFFEEIFYLYFSHRRALSAAATTGTHKDGYRRVRVEPCCVFFESGLHLPVLELAQYPVAHVDWTDG